MAPPLDKYTYITLVLTAAIFAFLRGLQDQPVMDLCATVCYSVFVGQMYRWRKTRKTENLILAAVTIITAVVATVRYFMGH